MPKPAAIAAPETADSTQSASHTREGIIRRARAADCTRHASRRSLLGASVAVLLSSTAVVPTAIAQSAQDYPTRPVKLIVPFAPGGATDTAARMLAERLSERLKQPVVVENKAGANNIIGNDAVAKAAPDGYTLLFAAAPFALNVALGMKLPYDINKDFVPISLVCAAPIVVFAHPSTPYKTLNDIVAAAKAAPAGLNYATAGAGSMPHLIGEGLKAKTKVNLQHIGYKGAAPALQDAIAGTVPVMIDAYIPTGVQAVAGKLRAIAVASTKRLAVLPDTQTVVEQGFPELTGAGFYGLLAPAGTPAAIIDKLHKATVSSVNDTDMRDRLVKQGYEVHASTPAEYAAYVRREIDRWTPIVQAAGIKP